MNVRTKIVVLILVPTAMVLAILIGTISYFSITTSKKSADEMMSTLARESAAYIESELDRAMSTARTLAQIFEGFEALDAEERRADYNNTLRKILEKNPGFIGIATCWEPDALDGMDENFQYYPGHDETGRFIPYWHRYSGKILLTPLVDYDVPGPGDWYLDTMESERENLTNPFEYSVDGKSMLITSLVVPIKNSDDTVVGVVAVDIKLETIQERYSDMTLFQSGFGRLVAGDGTVVIHKDPERLGKLWGEAEDGRTEAIFGRLKEGETFVSEEYSESLGRNTTKSFSPIFVGNAPDPWMYGVVVPTEEIYAASRRLITVAVVLGAAGLLIISLLILLVSSRIIKPLKRVSALMTEIASGDGDLTNRLEVSSRDETGILAEKFNEFITNLNGILLTIRGAVRSLKKSGSNLSTAMTETATAADEISTGIDTVNDLVVQQAAGVNEVSSTMEEIARTVENQDSRIASQAASVDQSSSAIEEMVANIKSVTRNLETSGNHFQDLAGAAEGGQEKLLSVQELIEKIAKQSDGVLEANAVIQNVASQTNLLSMNAAIEAAHAGEAGKGFSVVAEEIRKLAENADEQSRSISTVLNGLKDSINEVVESSRHAGEAFSTVMDAIETVKRLEEQNRRAMEEQSAGSTQVLQALQEIQQITAEVKDGSREMNSGSRAILEEMTRLVESTDNVRNKMAEMAVQTRAISTVVENVKSLTDDNQKQIAAVAQEEERFTLDEE